MALPSVAVQQTDQESSTLGKRRRRPSESTHDNVTKAVESNTALAQESSFVESLLDQGSPVAFSREGLVAHHHKPNIPGQVVIAIAPLISSSSTKPLLLHAPLPPTSSILQNALTYKVHTLQFSPLGNSLIAVIKPVEPALSSQEYVSAPGLLCIWSRGRNAGALNEGWNVVAAWTLSKQSPIGPDVVAVQWLSDSRTSEYVVKQSPPASNPGGPTGAPMPPQLPGMNNDANRAASLAPMKAPPRGPRLLARGVEPPEGVLLIGSDGVAHLAHRNTSIDQTYPYPQSLAAIYSVKPFTLLSAPLGSPSLAGSLAEGRYPSTLGGQISKAVLHPVLAQDKYIVASISESSPRTIFLTELRVTNHISAVMTTRPLQAIDTTALQWPQGADTDAKISTEATGHLTHIVFTSSFQTNQNSSEELSLVAAFCNRGPSEESSRPRPQTLLASYSLTSQASAKSQALSEAFGTLESKKASVDTTSEEENWAVNLYNVATVNDRSLVSLRAARLRCTDSKLGSSIQGFWIDHSKRSSSPNLLSDLHSPTLQPRNDLVLANWSSLRHMHMSVSHNEAVLAELSAYRPSSPALSHSKLSLTRLQLPWTSHDKLEARYQSLAASIFEAVLNKNAYDDILIASSGFLASVKNRKGLFNAYLSIRGINRLPASIDVPPGWMLLELCNLALKMNTIVSKDLSRSSSRTGSQTLANQSARVTGVLDLIHRYTSLQSARQEGGQSSNESSDSRPEWDTNSLLDLLPVISSFIAQCESLSRTSLLLRLEADADKVNREDFAVLALFATHAGLRRIFVAALQSAFDLIDWLRATAEDASDLVQKQAKALLDTVMLQKTIRKPFAGQDGEVAQLSGNRAWPGGMVPQLSMNGLPNFPSMEAFQSSSAAAASSASVKDCLWLAKEALDGMMSSSSIDVSLFQRRLRSFEGAVPVKQENNVKVGGSGEPKALQGSENAAIVELLMGIFNFEEGEEADGILADKTRCTQLARHLVGDDHASSAVATNDSHSAPPAGERMIKRRGLDLLVNADDFVHSISDVDVRPDAESAVISKSSERDPVTCILASQSRHLTSLGNRRRHLVTGRLTTYPLQGSLVSGQPRSGLGGENAALAMQAAGWPAMELGGEGALGIQDGSGIAVPSASSALHAAAGGQPFSDAVDPCAEKSIVEEVLTRPGAVQEHWTALFCRTPSQWWRE
ncbi:unnamed protein product [Sympodiomycopsis kandeliae]